ncbi:MAG TPA: tetratricopeptide repeat protein [Kofleriaceae bacterium]|nr:tetratricopeptide repeat protein [Kofleriaceae bacterium]
MRAAPLLVCAGVLLLAATAAAADAPRPQPVGRGYVLDYDGHGLRVRKGKRAAPLYVQDGLVWRADITVEPGGVTVTHMPACDDIAQTFTYDQLEARLVFVEGQQLHTRKRFDEAAERFAEARRLDPTFVHAELSLPRTLVAAGRLEDALDVLAPRLTADPLGTYLAVATDFALVPLRSRDELVRVRPALAGTARIDPKTRQLGSAGLALSPAGWIATIESQGNHGACSYGQSVVFRDASPLAVRASLPLVEEGDFEGDGCERDGGRDGLTPAGRANIRKRVAKANRLLAELGFSPPVGAIPGHFVSDDSGRDIHRMRFAKTQLGVVVAASGAVRVFHDDRMVAELPPGTLHADHMSFATYLPTHGVVLVSTMSFGCEWAELRDLVALPVPAPPAAPPAPAP